MRPVLNIRLFGNFYLTYDGEPLSSVKSAPMRALLAYLLLYRDSPQSRQHVAYRLWPDSSEAQARTNLRRELHHLRRALPDAVDFLHDEAGSLQWRPDAPYTLDVAVFEAAIDRVTQAEGVGDDTALRATLEESVALYPGDLLPGCYDDWIVSERERLSQAFVRLLERLIQLQEGQRDYAAAIQYTQRLLRYDPLHEATYRRLMRLYALAGDRARALRVYHTCVTTLQQELGVDPSPATQETYERLLDFDRAPVQQPTLAPASNSGRLVERHSEWERLQDAWRRAARTPSHFVLVTGDAGIGKTRLVEELLVWTGRQGIRSARTRCFAAEGQLAYAPVADWLRSDAFRAALLDLEEVWLAEVVRLLPELLGGGTALARPGPLTDSGQRLRLFEALARVVLAGDQPLLLVIDDLQWCDRETLQWLHYLLRYAPHARLLVAGTARAEEVSAEHPLAALVRDLHNSAQVSEVELGPLSPQATAVLAAQVQGRDLDPALAARLHGESEGNPLFVVEMVRAGLAQEKRVSGTAHPRVAHLPPRVHAIIQARLAQLSPQARELADLAATIGRSFTFNVLAQARTEEAGDESALVRGLDELWQRRIVREQGADAYDFSHDKLREVAYAEVSRTRQQFLHRRVAQALEAVYAANLDGVSGQIAVHYERSGLWQPAVRYYQRAAEQARHIYANEEAKALFTHAIEASERITPALDVAQLLPLYDGRAQVCRSLTQLDEAIADWEVVRYLARAAGDRQKEGESLCQMAYTHWLTFAQEQIPTIEQYAQEAIACTKTINAPTVLARALTMLGAVDQVQRNIPAAGRKLEEALQISRQVGDKDALVQSLAFLCLQAYLQGDFPSTVQFGQEGVAVARQIHSDLNELRIQAFVCQAQWSLGYYTRAFTLLRETMAQAEARGNRFVQGRLLNTLGWFHHELGDFATAIAYNQQSAEMGRTVGVDHVELSALVNLGYDYLAAGEATRAYDVLESTLDRVEREGFGSHKWQWQMKLLMGLAEHAYVNGDYAQALHYAEAGLGEAPATYHKYIAKGRALRGRILHHLGDSEAAGDELRQAVSLAKRLHSPLLTYPLVYALGQWHETVGNAPDAAALFAKAQALVEQIACAVEDERLRAVFLQSDPVHAIAKSVARTL